MSKALEARDKMTEEAVVIESQLTTEQILKDIDIQYSRNPSQKLLDERLKTLIQMMKERGRRW
jgi:hypothetical protein